jgi:glycosyltransferase involved in cell wall biosynthesis
MQNPVVSFVVPCYKLAHLLPECIQSILSQTYRELEILIMDDCSPDNTADVARSFGDPRVRHIRNEPNLGHLRNYNKGIGLCRGRYIWLISADDYLRKPYVLGRYASVLEQNPNAGYAFCPGFGVLEGQETRVLGRYPVRGGRDRIIRGHVLLRSLLYWNFVLAASGLVRRECYEKLGAFPLDMPWAGDWYLWCHFALHYDVAYFAEPMVCYRTHELSMTNKLFKENVATCCEEDVRIPWTIKQKADEAGFRAVSRDCLDAVAQIYALTIATKRYGMSKPSLTFAQFEESLCRHTASEAERERVRARVDAGVGNEYYWQRETGLARKYYQSALKRNPWMLTVYAKRLLLSLGKPGDYVRKRILSSP